MNRLVEIKKIVIVGEGYFPYLTGIFLLENFSSSDLLVSIVELKGSESDGLIKSMGSMRELHAELGLSEVEFVSATKAEINLGYAYSHGGRSDNPIMFSDAQYGFNLGNRRFHYLYRRYIENHPDASIDDFCLSAKMAKLGRFTPPSKNSKSVFSTVNYGYRLTEQAYKKYLRSKFEARGGNPIFGQVTDLSMDENGSILSISVNDTVELAGQLFIDCSSARILKESLEAREAKPLVNPFGLDVEYRQALSEKPAAQPYTRIGLDGKAVIVEATLNGVDVAEHYVLRRSGLETSAFSKSKGVFVDSFAWNKNCISMGPAFTNNQPILIDGFVLGQYSLLCLKELWPRTNSQVWESLFYNRKMMKFIENVIELDLLNYGSLTGRTEVFTDNLKRKIRGFVEGGKVIYNESEILQSAQWPILFYCLGYVPKVLDISIQGIEYNWLTSELNKIKEVIAKAAQAPPHYEKYLKR